ncbi:hypothetical protein ACFQ71_23515 [Streptomyces sp. NPDC056534]|uniref:hypothetical protein n=1 Tax=Streptomyces sp. NPDC056534 TaxID=3345857 RepID=UPI0036A45297
MTKNSELSDGVKTGAIALSVSAASIVAIAIPGAPWESLQFEALLTVSSVMCAGGAGVLIAKVRTKVRK